MPQCYSFEKYMANTAFGYKFVLGGIYPIRVRPDNQGVKLIMFHSKGVRLLCTKAMRRYLCHLSFNTFENAFELHPNESVS